MSSVQCRHGSGHTWVSSTRGGEDDQQLIRHYSMAGSTASAVLHQTLFFCAMLPWDLLQCDFHWTNMFRFSDSLVEREFIRFNYYTRCTNIPFFFVGIVGFVMPFTTEYTNNWHGPFMSAVGALLILFSCVRLYLGQKQKKCLKYDDLVLNCHHEEMLCVAMHFVGIFGIFASAATPSGSTESYFFLRSLRVIFLSIVGPLLVFLTQLRFCFALPILMAQWLACSLMWHWIPSASGMDLHEHNLEAHSFIAIAFFAVIFVILLSEIWNRRLLVGFAELHVQDKDLASDKEQCSRFVNAMLPETALKRTLSRSKVVDIATECTMLRFEVDMMDRIASPQASFVVLHAITTAVDEVFLSLNMEKMDFRGDYGIAVCGITSRCQHHASYACTAGILLKKLVAECSLRSGIAALQVRCGIHSGPLLGIVVGDRFQYDVFGSSLAIVAELCKVATPGIPRISRSVQNLIADNHFFVTTEMRTTVSATILALDPRQRLAYDVMPAPSWDLSLNNLPAVDPTCISYTALLRQSYLDSVFVETEYHLSDGINVRSLAGFGELVQSSDEAIRETHRLTSRNNDFARLMDLIEKHTQRYGCCRLLERLPPALNDAQDAFYRDSTEMLIICLQTALVPFVFDLFVIVVCIVVPQSDGVIPISALSRLIISSSAILYIISALLYKMRLKSQLLDATCHFLPEAFLGLFFCSVELPDYFVLRDPLVLRIVTLISLLSLSRRFPWWVVALADTLIVTLPCVFLSLVYYTSGINASLQDFGTTVFVLVSYSVGGIFYYWRRCGNEIVMSHFLWAQQKLVDATKMELQIYQGLILASFPSFVSQRIFRWYLSGMNPNQLVVDEHRDVIIITGTVTMKGAMDMEDPHPMIAHITQFHHYVDRLLEDMQRSSGLTKISLVGDRITVIGPLIPEGEEEMEERSLRSSFTDLARQSKKEHRSLLDIETKNQAGEMECELKELPPSEGQRRRRVLRDAVMFCASLEEVSAMNNFGLCVLCSVGDAFGAAVGKCRIQYKLYGSHIGLLEKYIAVAPDVGVFALKAFVSEYEQQLGPCLDERQEIHFSCSAKHWSAGRRMVAEVYKLEMPLLVATAEAQSPLLEQFPEVAETEEDGLGEGRSE